MKSMASLASVLLILALCACRGVAPHTPPVFDTTQVEQRLAEGMPPPVGGTTTATTPVATAPLRVDPSEAAGVADLPTTITQLYTEEPIDLPLADVVRQTLDNNRSIRIEGYTLRIAEYEIPVSRGIYDLLLFARTQFDRTESPADVDGADDLESRSRLGQFGVSQLLPTGAVISAGYAMARATREFIDFTPAGDISRTGTHTHVADLELRQPLLRGFGPAVTNAGIRVAQIQHEGAAANFHARLEQTLARAISTYWELLGAIEIYQVRIINYAAARDLLRINQRRLETGVGVRIDVLQAEAAAEARREQLIVARRNIRELEDQLKRLIFLDESHPLWSAQIRPTQPFTWSNLEVDLDQTIELALAERPELRAARTGIELGDVDVTVARNRMLPALDLFARTESRGIDDDFTDAAGGAFGADYTGYSVGLEFSYPLQNRAARYRHAQAEVGRERAVEGFRDTQDQVVFEVRRAVRNLMTARERILVTEAQLRAETGKLQDEQRRYEVGVTTAFQILTFQEDLAFAESQHLNAVIDYNIAQVELDRARGTLLRTFGVEVVEPELAPRHQAPLFPVGWD